MDYTLLEIGRILGKSKSTIEYQVKKLTPEQTAAFCFVDQDGVRRMNSDGLEYFKNLYALPETMPPTQQDKTPEALIKAVEALTDQLRAKDEQITALLSIVAEMSAEKPEATPPQPQKKLPWYKRKKNE